MKRHAGFVLLVALGVQTAIAAPDRFGMLLAGGVASWFGVQAIVNIGGVANITQLPADESQAVTGYDTGPGNNLMDGWIKQHKHQPYDNHGEWARSGQVNDALLASATPSAS